MAIPADQQAYRSALGRAYTVWMRRQNFSQQSSHDWAKAAGCPGPHNSQMSLLQRGLLDPKALFWVAMAQWNAAIATKELPPTIARSLRDRILAAEPYLNIEGTPATAIDFFGQFIGALPINPIYDVSTKEWTDEEATGVSEMCRTAFRKAAMQQMLTPAQAWDQLKPHCQGMTATQVERFREVLAGWSDWTAEEVTALSPEGELGRPAQALDSFANGLTINSL